MKGKSIVFYFRGFSYLLKQCSKYLEGEMEEFEVVSVKQTIKDFVKHKFEKRDKAYFLLPDLRLSHPRILIIVLLLVSAYGKKLLIDAEGRIEKVSWSKLAVKEVPRLFVEIMFTPVVVFLSGVAGIALLIFPSGKNKPFPQKGTLLYVRPFYLKGLIAGGASTHIRGVMKGFVKCGWKVKYVALEELKKLDVGVEEYYVTPTSLFQNFRTPAVIIFNFKVFFMIMKLKADAVYIRLGLFLTAPFMYASLRRVPLILEFNGPEVPSRKWWNKGHFTWWTPLASFLEDVMIRKSDFVVTVSEELKAYLEDRYHRVKRILVNPNGFDEELFEESVDTGKIRKKWNIPQDKILITHVSTFAGFHGTKILAESARVILEKRKDVFFLFVGDGIERPEVEYMLKGFRESVLFTGIVTHRDAADLMKASDILVASHVASPVFVFSPIKIFEYMASGGAVVATAVGQIKEIITDGKSGILVRPGSVQELAGAIEELLNNPHKRKQLAQEARKEAFARYTWTAHVKRIIEFCLSRS